MSHLRIGLIGATLSLVASSLAQSQNLDRYIYPLAKPIESPRIEIDVKDVPNLQAWAERAQALATEWFPTLTSLLSTQNYKAPKTLKLIFRKTLSVPAYTSGDGITINGEWVASHPEDFGMVIHELTHVVQSYPGSRKTPGWLVEGIADYTRWWRYEPDAPRPRIDKTKANYTDAYRTTAYWLAWVGHKYDMRLVPTLDRKMRDREDPLPVFEQLTGKTPEDLWKEFIEALP